ncbi:MAG: hypothetical protein ACTSWN_08725 [Promethearchaeota archaeon]
MDLDINYTVEPFRVVDPAEFKRIDGLLSTAGINNIWLATYMIGSFIASVEVISEAKSILEASGYQTGALIIPVGHPGMDLHPEGLPDPLEFPENWRYRVNRFGRPVLHCADIESRMIADNKRAVQTLRDAGFKRIFYDDDLRMGNYGSSIQGCFCDSCLEEFNDLIGGSYSRGNLARVLAKPGRSKNWDVIEKWTRYQCSKVNYFIKAMKDAAGPDVKIGLMVMAYGDERHGIDIPWIRANIPGVLFRLGEINFSDGEFGSARDKARELLGMVYHLQIMGQENTYSETTCYPANALSPENWVVKTKMALLLGMNHIFLMGGIYFLDDAYWKALNVNRGDFKLLRSLTKRDTPDWPIHLLKGDYRFPILPLLKPFLSGIPVAPIRWIDMPLDSREKNMADPILLILGRLTRLPKSLDVKDALARYRKIIIDHENRNLARAIKGSGYSGDIIQLPPTPISSRLIPRHAMKNKIKRLRMLFSSWQEFPFCNNGDNITVFWYSKSNRILLMNLADSPSRCIIFDGSGLRRIRLGPVEIKSIPWIEKD